MTKTARRKMIRFLLLFVLFWTGFFFVAWMFTDQLKVLCPWTATQVCWAMKLVGVNSSCSGSLVSFGPRSVTIVMECTALQVVMIYAALILAYPSTIKAKAIGLGLGLPLILAVNVVRLVVICFVLWWKPQYFEMMHIYIWQVVFIVVVVAMAALWIEKVVHRERRASVSH
jgi:archaeosortase B (VPXXXP-CTERM-specific)